MELSRAKKGKKFEICGREPQQKHKHSKFEFLSRMSKILREINRSVPVKNLT